MNDREVNEKEISTLIKNNLSSDNTALLIGSGCSTGAVPLMGETMKKLMKDTCIKKIVKIFIEKENTKDFKNIEGLLNYIQNGIFYLRDEDEKKKLEEAEKKIKEEFIKTIPKISDNPDEVEKTIKLYSKFYKKIFNMRDVNKNKLSIFTTNYDLFNEIGLENNDITYTTGFNQNIIPNFDISQFKHRKVDTQSLYKDKWQPARKEANIYKIHGSINWVEKDEKLIIDNNSDSENVIIYPTMMKHAQTRQSPYSELFRELTNCLQRPNSSLVVIGYGFSDEHINTLIFENLKNDDFILIIFTDEEEKLKKYKDKKNIYIINGTDETTGKIKYHHFDYIVENFFPELDSSDENE